MKKNTWNVRRLVDESLVPSAQQTSVSYCRLSDFSCKGVDKTIKIIIRQAVAFRKLPEKKFVQLKNALLQ